MSVSCNIKVCNPSDRPFIPGGVVAGVIEYSIYEENLFKNVIVSLKGKGHITTCTNEKYISEEEYINNNHYLTCNAQETTLPSGYYEKQFNFILPRDLPPSFESGKKQTKYYEVRQCNVSYSINVHFKKSNSDPDIVFKEIITIGSKIIPRLPTTPTTLEEIKKTSCFLCKPNVIHIKATIEKSVVSPNEPIKLKYKVINNSRLTVKGIVTKVIEVYTFNPDYGGEGKNSEEIVNINSCKSYLKGGNTKADTAEISIPPNRTTVENVTFVSRNYFIKIIAKLPIPHRDAVLKIPIQIGVHSETESTNTNEVNELETEVYSDEVPSYLVAIKSPEKSDDLPPSYWEAMGKANPSGDPNDGV